MHVIFVLKLVLVYTLFPAILTTTEEYGSSLGGLGFLPIQLSEGSSSSGHGTVPLDYGGYEQNNFDAAIHSKRTVSVVPVHETYEEPKVNSVSVDAAEMPLVLTLKSKSSPLIVNAVHVGSEKGSIKKTQSVDAPHIRVHETLKPVLQEVREIVQPKRQITQMISPVMQKINTFVSSKKGGNSGYGGHRSYIGPGHYGVGELEGGVGYGGGLDYGGHVMDYGGGLGGHSGLAGDYEGYGKGELLDGYNQGMRQTANVQRKRSKKRIMY